MTGARVLCERRQWHYYFLTDEGIEYVRNYLHIPADVVPATLKPRANVMRPGSERFEKRAGPGGNFRSDSVRSRPALPLHCPTLGAALTRPLFDFPQRREGRGFRREYRD